MASFTLYFSKGVKGLANLVASPIDPSPADMNEIALGEKPTILLIILNEDGSVATESNGGGYTAEIAIGRPAVAPVCYQNVFSISGDGRLFELNCATTELAALLAGVESIDDVFFEYKITSAALLPDVISQVSLVVRNSVIDATSLSPTPLPSYLTTAQSKQLFAQIKFTIIGLTGGGSTKLDGQVTAGGTIAAGEMYAINISGEQHWRLEAGTDAEDAITIVRPDDYNASTNAFVWKRYL